MNFYPPNLASLYVSNMGHDKGRVYVITHIIDEKFVLVCDGKVRKLQCPKKKRFKHLDFVLGDDSLLKSILDGTINDEEIRKLIVKKISQQL